MKPTGVQASRDRSQGNHHISCIWIKMEVWRKCERVGESICQPEAPTPYLVVHWWRQVMHLSFFWIVSWRALHCIISWDYERCANDLQALARPGARAHRPLAHLGGHRGLFGTSRGQNINIDKANHTLCDSSNNKREKIQLALTLLNRKLRYSSFSTLLEIRL